MGVSKEEAKYYHLRDKYHRRCKYMICHASLAETEEEYNRYWKIYKNTLSEWRRLKVPETISKPRSAPLQKKTFYRPVFCDEYVMYTKRLKELYRKKEELDPSANSARAAVNVEIKQLEKLRWDCTDHINTATGRILPKAEHLPKECAD